MADYPANRMLIYWGDAGVVDRLRTDGGGWESLCGYPTFVELMRPKG